MIIFLALIIIWPGLAVINAQATNDLKKNIEDKSVQLESIKSEINKNQTLISNLSQESQSLKNDIKKINANINQLNLSIRASDLLISKLELEIDYT